MRKLAIITFVTADGVMQAPMSAAEDISGGFDQGGWAAPYAEAVMENVQKHAMSVPYDMLFGRKTYDLFAGHWPNQSDTSPIAVMMNAAQKYVVTSNPKGLDWENSLALTGSVTEEIKKLRLVQGPLIQVHGSGELIQTLLADGLVDELRLWIFPTVLGRGKKLFEPGTAPQTLELAANEPLSNGVIRAVYRPAK